MMLRTAVWMSLGDSSGLQTVAPSMDEAYELLKVSPEDFTQSK
jgi:hypothetical protein